MYIHKYRLHYHTVLYSINERTVTGTQWNLLFRTPVLYGCEAVVPNFCSLKCEHSEPGISGQHHIL